MRHTTLVEVGNLDQRSENGSSFPKFRTSPLREKVLGEVHARPFRALTCPRTILHYAFLTDAEEAVRDQAWLSEFCVSRGGHGPTPGARHHTLTFGGGTLSWEQHAEFTTYTWDGAAHEKTIFGSVPINHPFGAAFRAPGDLLVAVRVELRGGDDTIEWRSQFDDGSMTVSTLEDGAALVATDFRQDGDGLTRILVCNRTMSDVQSGSVVQRLLEVETYRTLAMLGLFEATSLQPDIRRFELELADLTGQMKDASALGANQELLDKLSALAAALEAGATASTFRFGASRAYDQIVRARLEALREEAAPGELSMASFLARRLAPAMRTCQAIEDRQAMLSRKLARATTPLAHTGGCGTGRPEPEPAQVDEQACAPAVALATDGRGPVGGRGQLLCGRTDFLSGQGCQERGAARSRCQRDHRSRGTGCCAVDLVDRSAHPSASW